MKAVLWLSSVFAAILGFFSIKKRIETRAVQKERKQLNKAVKVIEKQLRKTDKRLDEQARKKIETIQKATAEILQKTPRGSDANALITKIRNKQ
tara:strand:+ start:738 stop:1019 length:282 start_codon:yes stop_codon:yes gene_type:complete